MLQKGLPEKCKDPGVFTIPCKLGSLDVPHAMCWVYCSLEHLKYKIIIKCVFVNSTLINNNILVDKTSSYVIIVCHFYFYMFML